MLLASNTNIVDNTNQYLKTNTIGDKRFELSNHLGNFNDTWVLIDKTLSGMNPETTFQTTNSSSGVLVVVSDHKLPTPTSGNNQVSYFTSDVISYSDYYPFGMFSDTCFLSSKKLSRTNPDVWFYSELVKSGFSDTCFLSSKKPSRTNPDKAQAVRKGLSGQMPNRHGADHEAEYRYGFNGMEKDDEIKGSGNSYDFGARIYDPRVGRWLSIDKKYTAYPNYSPYNMALNNPVYFKDFDGNLLVDPDGNIIYTVVRKAEKSGQSTKFETTKVVDQTITVLTYRKTAIVEKVLIYANDGTPIQATRTVGYEYTVYETIYEKNEDGTQGKYKSQGAIKTIDASDIAPNVKANMNDPSYDCHGLTFTNGEFWINSDQAKEILIHDGYKEGNENNSKLVMYYLSSQNTQSEIIHSTPLNIDGTVNSKRGTEEEVQNVSVSSEANYYKNEMENSIDQGQSVYPEGVNIYYYKILQTC